jgi:hypothetical protein
MRYRLLPLLVGICCLFASLAAAPLKNSAPAGSSGSAGGAMQTYPTRYYIIHTDLGTEDVKEAIIRMNRMAEEYHARTQGFSGELRERQPFYLFRTKEEYYEAGGLPGSAGVFISQGESGRLMAIAGDQTNGTTWHVVQHEGFHQFAHAVIRGELPPWVNEGIAEYFGESLFTGDGFVTGIVPPWRLKRLQEEIKTGQLKSVKEMMLLSHNAWNAQMRIENYDQAWSMVHFLAHGEDGRYQDAFVRFMKLIGRGGQWPQAWLQTFGSAADFEQHWKDYWLSQPPNPTKDLYAQAATAIFTSFIARARAQKQTFDSFEEFLNSAQGGKVKTGQTVDEWLPPKLLEDAAKSADRAPAKWKIESNPANKTSRLVAELEDGTTMTGSYVLVGGHATNVHVDVDDTGAALHQAQSLINDGKKDQARIILQRALRAHPKSASADAARRLMAQTK